MPRQQSRRRCSTIAPRAALLGLVAALTVLAGPVPAAAASPPPNDDFAGAQTVRVGDRVTGVMIDATLEAGEPAPSSPLMPRSVWYRLSTAVAAIVRVDSCAGTGFAEPA